MEDIQVMTEPQSGNEGGFEHSNFSRDSWTIATRSVYGLSGHRFADRWFFYPKLHKNLRSLCCDFHSAALSASESLGNDAGTHDLLNPLRPYMRTV